METSQGHEASIVVLNELRDINLSEAQKGNSIGIKIFKYSCHKVLSRWRSYFTEYSHLIRTLIDENPIQISDGSLDDVGASINTHSAQYSAMLRLQN